jgi:hypothetical protein
MGAPSGDKRHSDTLQTLVQRERPVRCAAVLDACSCRAVSWFLDAAPTAALVTNAPGIASTRGGPWYALVRLTASSRRGPVPTWAPSRLSVRPGAQCSRPNSTGIVGWTDRGAHRVVRWLHQGGPDLPTEVGQ